MKTTLLISLLFLSCAHQKKTEQKRAVSSILGCSKKVYDHIKIKQASYSPKGNRAVAITKSGCLYELKAHPKDLINQGPFKNEYKRILWPLLGEYSSESKLI
jgi:hypothetical protein